MAVSFGLFDTLVSVEEPADPSTAIRDALEARGIGPPENWSSTYEEEHFELPEGAAVPVLAQVCAVLQAHDVPFRIDAVRQAVIAALDPTVERNEGATEALSQARASGPVAICANCPMPELVGRALTRAGIEVDQVDACVTSVGCGWRKPRPEIFRLTADRLGIETSELVHVGGDPDADRGVAAVGGRSILLEDTPLHNVGEKLE